MTCLRADFYAKVCMMRQNVVVKTRRTDVIKRDVAPKFNESFSFKMMMTMLYDDDDDDDVKIPMYMWLVQDDH